MIAKVTSLLANAIGYRALTIAPSVRYDIEGRFMTLIPALASAAILSAAVPDEPEDDRPGVPHAAARGRGLTGDESDDWLFTLSAHEFRGLLLVRAADLADHDDPAAPRRSRRPRDSG